MELQQLRYVAAVADTGNFTRAAEQCFVSQPSLSQQIINLESELGHKLFHRLGRKAVLTEAGAAFLERTRKILIEVEDAAKAIRDDPSLGRTIVVGANPTLAPYIFPVLLERCKEEYPNLVVHTREDFRVPLSRAVADGELDLAIVSLPVQDLRLSIESLFREPLLLVVGRNHPLAKKREVSAHDLAHETFILLGDSSSLATQIQRFCGDHDFEPNIGHRCAQVATVRELVAAGMGISILPQVAHAEDDHKTLVYRKLSGRAPTREIGIIRHLQRYQSRGAEQFIALLRKYLKTTVAAA
jgi:LysR family hydrogen peroxide-inducible transcriptional activator